jgi:hypothetical protein
MTAIHNMEDTPYGGSTVNQLHRSMALDTKGCVQMANCLLRIINTATGGGLMGNSSQLLDSSTF